MSADVQGLELVKIRSKDNYRIRGLQIDENANPPDHLSPFSIQLKITNEPDLCPSPDPRHDVI